MAFHKKQHFVNELFLNISCVEYLKVFNLLHYSRTQNDSWAFFLCHIILSRVSPLLREPLHLLRSLNLFLLEKLEHLEDFPIEFIHFYLHRLTIKVLEGAIHPPRHKRNKRLAGFKNLKKEQHASNRNLTCSLCAASSGQIQTASDMVQYSL